MPLTTKHLSCNTSSFHLASTLFIFVTFSCVQPAGTYTGQGGISFFVVNHLIVA